MYEIFVTQMFLFIAELNVKFVFAVPCSSIFNWFMKDQQIWNCKRRWLSNQKRKNTWIGPGIEWRQDQLSKILFTFPNISWKYYKSFTFNAFPSFKHELQAREDTLVASTAIQPEYAFRNSIVTYILKTVWHHQTKYKNWLVVSSPLLYVLTYVGSLVFNWRLCELKNPYVNQKICLTAIDTKCVLPFTKKPPV